MRAVLTGMHAFGAQIPRLAKTDVPARQGPLGRLAGSGDGAQDLIERAAAFRFGSLCSSVEPHPQKSHDRLLSWVDPETGVGAFVRRHVAGAPRGADAFAPESEHGRIDGTRHRRVILARDLRVHGVGL